MPCQQSLQVLSLGLEKCSIQLYPLRSALLTRLEMFGPAHAALLAFTVQHRGTFQWGLLVMKYMEVVQDELEGTYDNGTFGPGSHDVAIRHSAL